jgi:AraC-like DNA-binding protein
MFPHLSVVYWFRPPKHQKIRSLQVAKNQLYVEIILSGVGIYDGVQYTRGTVFCHTAGQMTLSEFPPGRPFTTLMFLFDGYKKRHGQFPHIGQWRHIEMLNQFAHDALEDYHTLCVTHSGMGTAHVANVESQTELEEKRKAREILSSHLFSTLQLNLLPKEKENDSQLPKDIFVVRYELERLDITPDWTSFSAHAGYSPAYLRELFKREFGVTPGRYRRKFLITTACKMLRDEPLTTVTDIAKRLNFPDLKSFYRVFQGIMGMTPGDYRKSKASDLPK